MEAQKKIDVTENLDLLSKYDPEFRFRQMTGITLKIVFLMTIILSIFHIYTAGFGVLQEWRHRAFHLAFVLPLVFFFYAIRKENTNETKHFVYDLVYCIIGTSMTAAIFREILHLSATGTAALAACTFGLLFYFKRREFWSGTTLAVLDFFLFTAMLGGLVIAAVFGLPYIHFGTAFRDPNLPLVFWSILLFGIFLTLVVLFVVQWLAALLALARGRTFQYRFQNVPYFDVLFALLSCLVSVYIFLEFNALVFRAGLPSPVDNIVGAFAMILILEGARRSTGPALPIISFCVLINCYLGPYFLEIPGLTFFAHRGYSIERIIEQMFLGTEGIYGIPLGVVATFVFHFVLFGIFISKTGLGQLFMDLAMALAGWSSGGPAKVSVISSGFMGSISGSSIANTVTTGSFTIPLMKRVGYPPQFAGAVEASASTGGQLMPPIMGAAAFIMAEFLGVPYIKIAACAVLPAVLYFFAVGFMVHLKAKKEGLEGLPRESLPKFFQVLREKWLLVGPLIIIVYLLISGSSPFLAAFWGIIFSVATGQIHDKTKAMLLPILLTVPAVLFRADPLAAPISYTAVWVSVLLVGLALGFWKTERLAWMLSLVPLAILGGLHYGGLEASLCAFWANMAVIFIGVFYKESSMRVPAILETLELGTKNAIAIGAACACIGFIVGATTLTGLGLKFAAAVIELARNVAAFVTAVDVLHLLSAHGVALFFTLIFTAIACFILGMGIPTTAQYIIASMIAAPALIQWGIHPLVSHMFVLYFAVLADVTPPVALAAYAASGISGANPFKTGFTAFSLASGGFIVPFVFVSAPIVLWLPRILDGTTPFDYALFVQVCLTMLLGVVALGATVIGYLATVSRVWERLATGVAAASLITPGTYSDIIGFGILFVVFVTQRARKRRLIAAPT